MSNYILLKFIPNDYQDDEQDYYDSRRSATRRRYEEDLELEARAEKRIINAKKVYNHL